MSGISETQLRELLGRGLVALQYVKKDGSTRNAVGTLNRWFIPRDKRPLGPEKRRVTPWVKDDYVRYYDFTVQNWRCLVCSEVIEAKPIDGLSPFPSPTREGGCEMEDDEPSDYNGMDYNDYKFEEALRKLENDLNSEEHA